MPQYSWATEPPMPLPSRWVLVEAPGRLSGSLDQVAVGPGGVLAIARWPGHVSVRRGIVRSGGSRRDLQVDEVAAATDALAALLQPAHRPVTCALIVVHGDTRPTRVPPGAVVLGAGYLTSIRAGLGTHLGPDDVADVLRRIAAADSDGIDLLPTVVTLGAKLQADRARAAGARRKEGRVRP